VQLAGGNEQEILVSSNAVQERDEFQHTFSVTGLRSGNYALSAFLNLTNSSTQNPGGVLSSGPTKKSSCDEGTCHTQSEKDKNNPKVEWVWCESYSCPPDCSCHLIRLYKGTTGDDRAEDLGKHSKSNKVAKDGTSKYTANCLAD
jgi:hypothetical protein